MSQQQPKPIDGITTPEPRAEWIRPEVDRLLAGGAESAGGPSFDAADLPS